MLTEYHTHEMGTGTERIPRNALKFGQSGEVDSKQGGAHTEGWVIPQPNISEVMTPQVELNGAVVEARILQPVMQCVRTKQIFDIVFDNPFLD